MKQLLASLLRNRRAAAAAEFAMVLPLLVMLLFSGLETANYFMNEHTLVKAVRNGARFAARQNFSNYTACSGDVNDPALTRTKNVVMTGYRTGGTIITPNIEADDIDVTTRCDDEVETMPMNGGVYFGRTNGAQIVMVQATVEYRSVVGLMGFDGIGWNLNARSEAAVAGI